MATAAQVGFGLDEVRLFLHVLGATIWVGGQLVLAALVPVLRTAYPGAAAAAARRFRTVAWPAFALLALTGIWNVIAIGSEDTAYQAVLGIKLVVVIASGVSAFVHERARTPRSLATTGAVTGLTALVALALGVVLAG